MVTTLLKQSLDLSISSLYYLVFFLSVIVILSFVIVMLHLISLLTNLSFIVSYNHYIIHNIINSYPLGG